MEGEGDIKTPSVNFYLFNFICIVGVLGQLLGSPCFYVTSKEVVEYFRNNYGVQFWPQLGNIRV